MKHFTSKYYIKPLIHNWCIFIFAVIDILISVYPSKKYRTEYESILVLIFAILIIWSLFYVIFETLRKDELKYAIQEAEKEAHIKCGYSFSKKTYIKHLKEIEKSNIENNKYINF